jgi:hypothetical protein
MIIKTSRIKTIETIVWMTVIVFVGLMIASTARAQISAQPANQFWATPLSTAGSLGLRTIGLADISGLLSFGNVTGSATCAQLPAFTGDITKSAGSCATTQNRAGDTTSATNPTTGNVGEVLSTSVSGTVMNSGTFQNLMSLSVTAGHWICSANYMEIDNASPNLVSSDIGIEISTTSLDTFNQNNVVENPFTSKLGYGNRIAAQPTNYNFTSTTTVYVVVYSEFTNGAINGSGTFLCQRIW